MASIEVVERRPKIRRTEIEVKLEGSEMATEFKTEFTVSQPSPIIVKGNIVEVDPSLMEVGELQFFMYKGRRYLAEKVDKNTVRIYEIEE